MSTVTFPGLGLTLHLNRVAFSIGTFHVYWYGIIIALGFFFGVAFCCAQAKKFGLKPDDILDMIIFAAPGGIIGARLYYIFFNPDLYRNPDGSWSLAACLSTRLCLWPFDRANCRTLGKLYERRGLWRPNGPALAHGN